MEHTGIKTAIKCHVDWICKKDNPLICKGPPKWVYKPISMIKNKTVEECINKKYVLCIKIVTKHIVDRYKHFLSGERYTIPEIYNGVDEGATFPFHKKGERFIVYRWFKTVKDSKKKDTDNISAAVKLVLQSGNKYRGNVFFRKIGQTCKEKKGEFLPKNKNRQLS